MTHDGIGTLRLSGPLSRAATADAGTTSWRLQRRGLFRTTIDATDAPGTVVGDFRRHSLRRGGPLRWSGRELERRPSSMWRERFALVEHERELAVIEGKSWGKRPVKVIADDADAIDAGLLLFAVFVVRALTEDAAAAAT